MGLPQSAMEEKLLNTAPEDIAKDAPKESPSWMKKAGGYFGAKMVLCLAITLLYAFHYQGTVAKASPTPAVAMAQRYVQNATATVERASNVQASWPSNNGGGYR